MNEPYIGPAKVRRSETVTVVATVAPGELGTPTSERIEREPGIRALDAQKVLVQWTRLTTAHWTPDVTTPWQFDLMQVWGHVVGTDHDGDMVFHRLDEAPDWLRRHAEAYRPEMPR